MGSGARSSSRGEKKHLEQQLSVASDIQNFLLPKRIPRVEGYEMAAFYQPCSYVGGDYYDFVEIDERHLGMLVADVAGKGFPGALVMVQVRTLMRSEAMHSLSPREVLIRMNRHLYAEIPRTMFVTMFYAVLNLPMGVLNCASAGHNPPLYWNQGRLKHEWVRTNGLALGVDAGMRFEQIVEEVRLHLQPSDRFVLYTDGVTETMDKKNELYGEARLARTLERTLHWDGHRFVAALLESLNDFRGAAPQHDDITVVTLRQTGEAASRPDGYGYLVGERFVRCSGCGTVNLRMVGRCPRCGRSTHAPIPAAPVPTPARAAPASASGRRCIVCQTRPATLGVYCPSCAPKSLQT